MAYFKVWTTRDKITRACLHAREVLYTTIYFHYYCLITRCSKHAIAVADNYVQLVLDQSADAKDMSSRVLVHDCSYTKAPYAASFPSASVASRTSL